MSASTPQECMTNFTDALIRRDIDAALDLMCEDVVLFYSNGTALWGKKAFAATMTANWKLISDYKYTTVEAKWWDNAVIYQFSWTGMAGGKAVSGSGRGTRVFQAENGQWRLAHEHLSIGAWQAAEQSAA